MASLWVPSSSQSVRSPCLLLLFPAHPFPLAALLPSSAPSSAPSSLDRPLRSFSPSKKEEKKLPPPPHNKLDTIAVEQKSRRLSSIGASSPSPGLSTSPFINASQNNHVSSSPKVSKREERKTVDVNPRTPAPSTSIPNNNAADADGTDEDLEYERALIQIAEDELGLRKRKLQLERKMRKRGKVEG
jgi:hypothetical protein